RMFLKATLLVWLHRGHWRDVSHLDGGAHLRAKLQGRSYAGPRRTAGHMLPARRERPRDRRAAEQRDEVAPLHSITSSVNASSVGGTSRLIALAVLRLMMNSNLVGACTGRSPGSPPFKM